MGGRIDPGLAVPRQWDGASSFVGKDRSPASVVALSVLTLGIYFQVWHHHINAEIRNHDPEIQVTPGVSDLAAIFPISNIVNAFCTASRIRQMQLDEGQTQTISPVLRWCCSCFSVLDTCCMSRPNSRRIGAATGVRRVGYFRQAESSAHHDVSSATFGKAKTKKVVTQVFTLTVT
jgi:hypothetical protein